MNVSNRCKRNFSTICTYIPTNCNSPPKCCIQQNCLTKYCASALDDEENFIESMLPFIRGLSLIKKTQLKAQFQQTLLQEMMMSERDGTCACEWPPFRSTKPIQCQDEDELFFFGLIPQIKTLDPAQRLIIRKKFFDDLHFIYEHNDLTADEEIWILQEKQKRDEEKKLHEESEARKRERLRLAAEDMVKKQKDDLKRQEELKRKEAERLKIERDARRLENERREMEEQLKLDEEAQRQKDIADKKRRDEDLKREIESERRTFEAQLKMEEELKKLDDEKQDAELYRKLRDLEHKRQMDDEERRLNVERKKLDREKQKRELELGRVSAQRDSERKKISDEINLHKLHKTNFDKFGTPAVSVMTVDDRVSMFTTTEDDYADVASQTGTLGNPLYSTSYNFSVDKNLDIGSNNSSTK